MDSKELIHKSTMSPEQEISDQPVFSIAVGEDEIVGTSDIISDREKSNVMENDTCSSLASEDASFCSEKVFDTSLKRAPNTPSHEMSEAPCKKFASSPSQITYPSNETCGSPKKTTAKRAAESEISESPIKRLRSQENICTDFKSEESSFSLIASSLSDSDKGFAPIQADSDKGFAPIQASSTPSTDLHIVHEETEFLGADSSLDISTELPDRLSDSNDILVENSSLNMLADAAENRSMLYTTSTVEIRDHASASRVSNEPYNRQSFPYKCLSAPIIKLPSVKSPEESQSLPSGTASAISGLPLAENSYDEISEIGTGAYGTVYMGREKNSSRERIVALKKLRLMLNEDGVPFNALREITLLKHIEKYDHPNIVKLLDICHGRMEKENRMSLILVFEFVEQDLEMYMKKFCKPDLNPMRIQSITHQILCGVDFLHTHRIVHRDLKPQNILISRDHIVKIADFGLAKVYDFYGKLTTTVVTLWYRAPEVLLSNSYSTSVDLWSYGCIFAEILLKSPLFEGQNEIDQLQRIFDIIGTPEEHDWPKDVSLLPCNFRSRPGKPIDTVIPGISPIAADLLRRLLFFNLTERISAKKALDHIYFAGLLPPLFEYKKQPSPSTSESAICERTSMQRAGLDSENKIGVDSNDENNPNTVNNPLSSEHTTSPKMDNTDSLSRSPPKSI